MAGLSEGFALCRLRVQCSGIDRESRSYDVPPQAQPPVSQRWQGACVAIIDVGRLEVVDCSGCEISVRQPESRVARAASKPLLQSDPLLLGSLSPRGSGGAGSCWEGILLHLCHPGNQPLQRLQPTRVGQSATVRHLVVGRAKALVGFA